MPNKAEIRILGTKYTIRGDATEKEMKELAAWVDTKIKEVIEKSPNVTPLNAAILAALNIAGELHALKKEQNEITERLSEKTSALSHLFE
ncbi:MAG: cell division protein ZapA [Nitrospiraceae bacterium]|nr:cell division protein ZapA [Nitrospiraceae bacterium]